MIFFDGDKYIYLEKVYLIDIYLINLRNNNRLVVFLKGNYCLSIYECW